MENTVQTLERGMGSDTSPLTPLPDRGGPLHGTEEGNLSGHHAGPTALLSGGLSVARTEDFTYLESLLRMPEIYERVADDASMPIHAINLAPLRAVAGALVLEVWKGERSDTSPLTPLPDRGGEGNQKGSPVGCFLLLPVDGDGRGWTGVDMDVHTVLGPECRGRHAWRAGRLGIEYMFTQTNCQRLVSRCPEDNPQSLIFAMCQGFRIAGRKQDWLKHGVLKFSTHVELRREDWEGTIRKSGTQEPEGTLCRH